MASGNAGKRPNRTYWHGFRKYLLSGAALGVVLGGAAHAQPTDTTSGANTVPANTKVKGVENVIVTAQRRTQNLQDVPVSIQVLSGARISTICWPSCQM